MGVPVCERVCMPGVCVHTCVCLCVSVCVRAWCVCVPVVSVCVCTWCVPVCEHVCAPV